MYVPDNITEWFEKNTRPVDPTLVLKEWNETHKGRLVYDPESDWFVREN